MPLSRTARIAAALVAIVFAVLGVAFWFAPAETAQHFNLASIGTAGFAALRADFGGLFLGLAVLVGFDAWTGRRSFLVAAAWVLGLIIAGRLLGWIIAGRVGGDVVDLAIELVLLATLGLAARSAGVAKGAGTTRRGRIVAAVGVAVVAALALALLDATVEQKIYDRAAFAMAARSNDAPFADDALRVALCGTSAPLPSAARAKACVAVFAGGRFYVVDAGPESVENLVLWRIPLSKIGGVLLTHFHSDHIGDLGELQLQTWVGGRPEPLAVYGGPGIEQVVAGFNQAYRQDQGYRTKHHGEKVMPSATWGMVAHAVELDGPPTDALDRTGLVLEDGALRITAIEVNHAPITPAYAFRFDYKGRSVVVTGDLKNHPPLVRAARGADLLVSEAIAPSMTRALGTAARSIGNEKTAAVMHDIEDYHITPEQAAAIANEADVRLLAFYHLLPAPDGFLARRLFAHGVNDVRAGDWTIADDGSLYTLPLDSNEVRIGRIDG
jgi:ribonuclease Z